jgi:hypothetical protein
MAKISIYIPDAKAEEVETWKDRVNLSEVFRDAFDRAVEKAKLSTMKEGEMENVIRRLKEQEDADFQAGKKKAFGVGVTWAKGEASLRVLRILFEPEEDAEGPDDDAFFELIGSDYRADAEGEAERGEHDLDSYLAGWREGFEAGADSIWQQVRSKI